jgi:rhodanese-related sulfurtransferase
VTISEISADELAAAAAAADARGERLRLIDVREDDEWTESRIPWAEQVVLGTVPDRLDSFGPDGAAEPTYVICKSGGRSMRACEFADARGKNVINVTGGMMAWSRAGHDAVSGV